MIDEQLVMAVDIDFEVLMSNYPDVIKIFFAVALGMLLGIEREWSQKPAGLRTFTLITLVGTVMVIADEPVLLALGGLLVVIQGAVFAVRGLLRESEPHLLTTSVSMVLAYVVGVLVGKGLYQIGVLVVIVASFLLVARRELHGFAQKLSKDEIQSAIEFGVLAFVIFPLLPNESFGPANVINPRTIWMLVVAMSAIGFANYLIVQRYGTRGIAITSFFGGLVNSTAVIGEIVSRSRNEPGFASIAVGSVLLANSAMALRDMIIVLSFLPGMVVDVGVPLGGIVITGILLSFVMSDWDVDFDIEFDSPFNLRTALKFGVLFFIVLLLASTARITFGTSGFLVSSFVSGMVSSGAVTTTVVLLLESGQLAPSVGTVGILAGVTGSILVKLGMVVSMDRKIARPVTVATAILLTAGIVATFVVARFLPQ